jgi:hypothetical protein
MGYDVIYDKNFIKVEQEGKETVYCPMLYAGSSNCFDWSPSGRDRRSRSWFPHIWLNNGELLGTKETMLAKVMEDRKAQIERHGDEYDDKRYGYFTAISIGGGGCNATFGQYKGIVLTGCKKALTVEQCYENNIYVYVKSGYDFDKKLGDKGSFLQAVSNTQDFLTAIENCKKHVGDSGVSVTVDLQASEDTMKWMRRKLFPKVKKKKEYREVNEYYTIYLPEYGTYFGKGTKRGFVYYYTPYKKYATEKEAQREVNRLNERKGDGFSEVKKIEGKTQIYV